MVRNCCRSIRSKMRVTWRRNFAGNLIALAVVTVFVVTYVKLLQYNKASSTTFNLVANRHRRPRGLHASHTEHRGSKNATSRLTVHVVEEHHQGKSLNVTHDDITFNRLISLLIRNIFPGFLNDLDILYAISSDVFLAFYILKKKFGLINFWRSVFRYTLYNDKQVYKGWKYNKLGVTFFGQK